MKYYNGSEWDSDEEIASRSISNKVGIAAQKLNYVDFLTSWDCREYDAYAWTQGFQINEDAQEIYVAAYHSTPAKEQWIECRNYDGTLKWKTDPQPQLNGDAFSEGVPYYYDGTDLCFIMRLDPGGNVRTYNTVTKVLSDQIPIKGLTKLYSDGKYFYSCDGQPTHAILTAVHMYTLESFKSGNPEYIQTIQLDRFGSIEQDNKPQGMAVVDGNFITAAGKYTSTIPGSGRLDLRVYNATGRIINSTTLDKPSFREALAYLKRPQDIIPNETSFENEGVIGLRDGRIAVMNHLHRQVYITIHGSKSRTRVDVAPSMYSNSTDWLSTFDAWGPGIVPYNNTTALPRYQRDGKQVFIQGAFKGLAEITSGSAHIATLPRGYRPSIQYDFVMPSNGTDQWRGYVMTSGSIRIVNYNGTLTANSWLPLNLNFIADSLEF